MTRLEAEAKAKDSSIQTLQNRLVEARKELEVGTYRSRFLRSITPLGDDLAHLRAVARKRHVEINNDIIRANVRLQNRYVFPSYSLSA